MKTARQPRCLPGLLFFGAGNGARTRDPQLGNQTGNRELSRYFSYFNNLRYGVPSRKAFRLTVLTAPVAFRLSSMEGDVKSILLLPFGPLGVERPGW